MSVRKGIEPREPRAISRASASDRWRGITLRGAIARTVGAVFCAAIAVAGPVHAHEAELVTDRPDFTESPTVVPFGLLQIESGVTFASADDTDTLSGLELLVRWPLSGVVELRLGLPDYVREGGDGGALGFADASLGAKRTLGHLPGGIHTAVIAAISVPTGEDGLTSGDVDPEILLTASRDLTPLISLGAQVGVAWPTEEVGRNATFSATTVLGVALADPWGTFVEIAVENPDVGATAVTFHHGYTYLVRSGLQLDLHAGLGLTDAAPNWFVAAGWSARF